MILIKVIINLLLFVILYNYQSESVNLSNRVYNGYQANHSEYPYLAMCIIVRPDGTFLCGGSLIHKKWVLSAGHCFYNATQATIKFGSSSYATNSSDPALTYNSTYFVVHELFIPGKLMNDIALARLQISVLFSATIRPIKLVEPDNQTYVARFGTSCGWGITTQNMTVPSPQLKCVDLLTIDNTECANTYGNATVTSTQICARGVQNSESTCNGDSGGPFVMDADSSLGGIVSFSVLNGCNLNYPVGFTRITSYLSWIYNKTGVNSSYVYQYVY